MNQILQDILDEVLTKSLSNIDLVKLEEEGVVGYSLDCGFYKSNGCVVLYVNKCGVVICKQRYDAEYDAGDAIDSFDELVRISHKWFEISKNRGYDGWKQPAEGWGDEYVRLGLMKKREETRTIYE